MSVNKSISIFIRIIPRSTTNMQLNLMCKRANKPLGPLDHDLTVDVIVV
jgi:hypothetical protein